MAKKKETSSSKNKSIWKLEIWEIILLVIFFLLIFLRNPTAYALSQVIGLYLLIVFINFITRPSNKKPNKESKVKNNKL